MTEQKYKLPSRKWYSLGQAVKEIHKLTGEEITIEDLIHFWRIGKLEICLDCSIYQKGARIGNKRYEHEFPLECLTPENLEVYVNNELLNVDILSKPIIRKINVYNQLEFYNHILNPEFKDSGIKRVNLMGFLSLLNNDRNLTSDETDLLLGNDISILSLFLASPKETTESERLIFYVNIKGEVKINKNDMFILHSDLIDFITDKSKPPKIEENKNKRPEIVKENQTNFIRTLLYMDYGIKTPAEAKASVRNGKLGQKFEKLKREKAEEIDRLNLKMPSETTLFNWLNNA